MTIWKSNMGTKVELDNFLPGYYSMRDLNRDSNGGSWPAYYGDNGFSNGQYYYGFLSRGFTDSYPGNKKDLLKQKMLEHEAIFKNQVYELHRLYKVQRNLMDEFKRKEGYKLETSSSSSPLPSHIPSEDMPKWNTSSLALGNSFESKMHVSPVADAQTPVSANKGKSIQVSLIPFQDCSSPKGSEASESRPTKFRRKMFDLQLPANEYIYTDEVKQCGEANSPDMNHKSASESGANLFVNNKEKNKRHGNGMVSGSLPRKSNTLADLNEPFVVEEHTSAPLPEISSSTMPRDGFSSGNVMSLPREIPQISLHDDSNGISSNVQAESKGYGRGWFSYILEPDQSREKLLDITPGPSKPVQCLFDSARRPGFSSSNSKEDLWRTKQGSERNYFQSGCYDSESYLRAQCPAPSSFSHTSDLVNTWDRPALSWEKPGSFLSQKPMSIQPNPCMNSVTFRRSKVQSNEPFSSSSMYNSNFGANLDFGSEMPVRNGFYHGSSSGPRELLGRGNDDNRVRGSSDCFIIPSPHIDANSRKEVNLNSVLLNGFSPYQQQMKTMGGASRLEDRHPAFPWLTGKAVSSKESASPRKALIALESAFVQTPSDQFSKDELKKSLDRLNSVASTSSIGPRREVNDRSSSRMILGVPIFDNPLVFKDEVIASVAGPSCGTEPFSNMEFAVSVPKAGFDMNVPYDPMDFVHDKAAADGDVFEKKRESGGSCPRDHIDLNLFASSDDVPPVNSNMKCVIDIDLEATAGPETEDDDLIVEESSVKPENRSVEVPRCSREEVEVASLVRTAAEAIVEISATCVIQEHVMDDIVRSREDSSENPLHWLAGVIFVDDVANHLGSNTSRSTLGGVQEDCLSSDSGYFESMTLKLIECDAEECVSKPPQVLNVEVTGTNASGNRARRGSARRGRQRRDFQRDILPGLTSLSRHEVTEDLQTFGGLMRATGYAWHSGPRRNATRNGCARGRRRSVTAPTNPQAANTVCALLREQLSNTTTTTNTTTTVSQVRLEDRSLTGWGRTTRRPRRQRFPAGNPAAIALT
ncbi:hypothetical protein AKJ16_DCAP11271 [Drosera capensis]